MMAKAVRVRSPNRDADDPIQRSPLAHQPALLQAFQQLYGTLWSRGVLDAGSKEVARLRNARITGCRYCQNVRFATARQQGLSEERVSLITDDFETSELSARQKLIIRYADVFLSDPSRLSPELHAALHAELSPEEVVELSAGLALFMGFSKIAIVLDNMPESMPVTVVPTPGSQG